MLADRTYRTVGGTRTRSTCTSRRTWSRTPSGRPCCSSTARRARPGCATPRRGPRCKAWRACWRPAAWWRWCRTWAPAPAGPSPRASSATWSWWPTTWWRRCGTCRRTPRPAGGPPADRALGGGGGWPLRARPRARGRGQRRHRLRGRALPAPVGGAGWPRTRPALPDEVNERLWPSGHLRRRRPAFPAPASCAPGVTTPKPTRPSTRSWTWPAWPSAPVTLVRHDEGHHGFEAVDATDQTLAVLDRAIAFLERNL